MTAPRIRTGVKFQCLASVSAAAILGASSVWEASVAADLGVVPVPAPGRTISGTGRFFLGYSFLSGCPKDCGSDSEIDADYWSLGGEGMVDIPFNEALSLQLDLYGEFAGAEADDPDSAADGGSENYIGSVSIAGHLNYRQMNKYLFGAFGGGGAVYEDDQASSDDGARFFFAGVEGQYYFGNSTLYGQVGVIDSDEISMAESDNEYLHNAWFIRGVGRHYFNQGRTKAEVELSWMDGDQSSTDDASVFGWGAELEHQFKSYGSEGGVNGFIRYDGRYAEGSSCSVCDVTDQTIMVGVSFDLNAGTPLERERIGVALDTPNFGRALGNAHTAGRE